MPSQLKASAAAIDIFFPLKAWMSAGVLPLGAQVRRTDGRCEAPLSSWKTIQARRRLAFFFGGPALRHPPLNRLLASLLFAITALGVIAAADTMKSTQPAIGPERETTHSTRT